MDKAMQIGRTGMFNVIRDQWAKWDLKEDGNLMNNLKKRGVDDTEALPKYPYRDDAILLWKAINDYVTIVVNHVYGECEDLNLKLLLVGLFFSSSDPRRQSLSKC